MGNYSADQAAPYRKWVAVTPSDTANLPAGCRGIYVTGAGDVVMVDEDNTPITFAAEADTLYWMWGPKRINDTSTTATGIFALY